MLYSKNVLRSCNPVRQGKTITGQKKATLWIKLWASLENSKLDSQGCGWGRRGASAKRESERERERENDRKRESERERERVRERVRESERKSEREGGGARSTDQRAKKAER